MVTRTKDTGPVANLRHCDHYGSHSVTFTLQAQTSEHTSFSELFKRGRWSPSHFLNPSLHSQQQPSPWDCPTIPKLQHPAAAPSRGPVRVQVWLWQGLSFSFHLGCHRSAVLLSALNVSPLTQITVPMWGSDPCFSSPACRGQVRPY